MGVSMPLCSYVSLRSRTKIMMSLGLLNSCSTYCFTLSLKFLNWYFMLRCSTNVPSTAPTYGTCPVKLAMALFISLFFLLIQLLWFMILVFLVFPFLYVAEFFLISPGWALICGGRGIFDRQSFLDFRFIYFFLFWFFLRLDFRFFTFLWVPSFNIMTLTVSQILSGQWPSLYSRNLDTKTFLYR